MMQTNFFPGVRPNMHRLSPLRPLFMVSVVAIVILAGCSTGPRVAASSLGQSHEEAVSYTNYWKQRYERRPDDRETALNFASALRRTGKADQAVAVLRRASTVHTEDVGVQSAYGKALAAQGDLIAALRVIQAAKRPELPDWRLLSAEGAILDQQGSHDAARARYTEALSLSENEPTVLSNLGMSHMLTGDLSQAEKFLRQALSNPNSDGRVRQNLSLVVGLQGRFEEAENIARSDLPQHEAAANIAFLRSLLTHNNTWEKLQQES